MFNLKTVVFVSSFVLMASNIYAADQIARGGGERGGNRGGGEHHQNFNQNRNHKLNQNQRQNLEEGGAIHSRQNQFSHYSPQFNEGTPNETNVQANQFRRATNQGIDSINRPNYNPYWNNGGYYNGGGATYVVPEIQYQQYPYQNNFIEAD